MLLLDALFRFPAITLLLLFAVLAVRDGRHIPAMRYAALMTFSVAMLLVHSAPPEHLIPAPLYQVTVFLNVADIAFAWWFGRALFEDDFHLGGLEWAGFVILVTPIFIFRIHQFFPLNLSFIQILDNFSAASSVAAMLHLAYVAIKGRADDMIEKRRAFRLYFVLALAATSVIIVVGERIFHPEYNAEFSVFRGFMILPLAVFSLMWLLKLQPEKLAFEKLAPLAPQPPKIDPRDSLLHERLIALMEQDKFFTEPGLTIRNLAEKLKAPEHHLRGLINKGLGYRNFSAFLNSYRIEAVKAAMSEPENSRLPVLTMAMDVGYNSLAPFNRAFKDVTGMTPSAYRAKI